MSPKKTTTIPLRTELEYMLDQRRLMRQLETLTVASLGKRQDSEELLAFLSMTVPEILNRRKLLRKLRGIANSITQEKLAELSELLGKPVPLPLPATINRWIAAQAEAVESTVEHWLATANAEVIRSQTKGMALADMTIAIRERAKQVSVNAERKASAAILQLNAEIIEEVARGAGSSHYRWNTERDDRVRPNHVALEGTIQKWNDPPAGGGTKPGDRGHPGSGHGCRCLPIPLQGPAQLGNPFSRRSPLNINP